MHNQYFLHLCIPIKQAKNIICLVRWLVAPPPWHILNVDGSSILAFGKSGIGGLLRDTNGIAIVTFSLPTGNATNNQTEAMALLYGMRLALQQNTTMLQIQSDSLLTLKMIFNQMEIPANLRHIIHECRMVMTMFDRVACHHVFREGNQPADYLAKRAASTGLSADPMAIDSHLQTLLLADANGLATPRYVST
ncbi:hypothetical protein ACHQM5_023400 [Ranunculus cassubicifolius]